MGNAALAVRRYTELVARISRAPIGPEALTAMVVLILEEIER
jgi:hypothetical protein